MRDAMTLPLLLAMAAAAAAQDTLQFKDPRRNDIPAYVLDLNFRQVTYEIDAGTNRVKQNTEAREIRDIVVDPNRQTFDFAQAQRDWNDGNFKAAAERYVRVMRDNRASPLQQQKAAMQAVRSHWNLGNPRGALTAIQALRQARPQSFYLPESYEVEIRCHLAMKNPGAAEKAVSAFAQLGRSERMKEWETQADVMRGNLFELQGKWRQALSIHSKYARSRTVPEMLREEAALGELRCLTNLEDWNSLKAKAETLLGSIKDKSVANPRLLTGLYNARGHASLNAGQFKEALKDFMRGVAVYAPRGNTHPEHESALAGAGIAAARFASKQADQDAKNLYRSRAGELLHELKRGYPGSRLAEPLTKAIQEVK